jgi:nucleoside diphosphate kinase
VALAGGHTHTRVREQTHTNARACRAAYGTDAARNAAAGSASAADARREAAFFFGPGGRGAAAGCAACGPASAVALVKPHAVRAGLAGQLLAAIQASGRRGWSGPGARG